MGKKAKRNEGSNQALIICLVFSVLLNIGMAVATFAGFSEQSALDGKIKDAANKSESARKSRDWEQYLHLKYKAALGVTLTKDEEDAFAKLQKEFASGSLGKGEPNRDDEEKIIVKFDTENQFNPQTAKFGKPILGELRVQEKAREAAEKKAADMKKNVDQAVADSNRRNKGIEEEINKLRDLIKAKEKEIVNKEEDKGKAFAELKEKFEQYLKDREVAQEKQAVAENELKAQISKLQKENKDLQDKYQKTVVKIAPIDMTVHSDPHGKIVRMDRSGGMVYIDLGSADRVKPQLTFSVYPAGSTKAKGERKASIEVVNVVGPHLSAARVTEVADPTRDPIIVNDALFNVAWHPSLRQHVAVAGLIDLGGDGSDNTEEFMRGLEKQNMVIDAYMDLKDREYTVKGEMTFKTNYLILGEVPNLDRQLPDTDPRLEQSKKILTRLSEMQNDAGRLGVTIVPARRFMSLIGYKTPKSIRPAEYQLRAGLDVGGAKVEKPAGDKAEKGDKGGDGEEKMEKPKGKAKEAMEKDDDEKPKGKAKAKEAMEKDDDEKPKAKAKKDKAKEDKEKDDK